MNKMIKDFISHCESYKKNEIIRHIKTPMQITNTLTKLFQLETVGSLRVSNGYRRILRTQCKLTKYVLTHSQ